MKSDDFFLENKKGLAQKILLMLIVGFLLLLLVLFFINVLGKEGPSLIKEALESLKAVIGSIFP